MDNSDLLKCEPISKKEAELFLKGLLKARVLVEDVKFRGLIFYQINSLDKMIETGASGTWLHLLLCNEFLLNVKFKNISSGEPDPTTRMIMASDWNKIPEQDKNDRFLFVPVQLMIQRKTLSPN